MPRNNSFGFGLSFDSGAMRSVTTIAPTIRTASAPTVQRSIVTVAPTLAPTTQVVAPRVASATQMFTQPQITQPSGGAVALPTTTQRILPSDLVMDAAQAESLKQVQSPGMPSGGALTPQVMQQQAVAYSTPIAPAPADGGFVATRMLTQEPGALPTQPPPVIPGVPVPAGGGGATTYSGGSGSQVTAQAGGGGRGSVPTGVDPYFDATGSLFHTSGLRVQSGMYPGTTPLGPIGSCPPGFVAGKQPGECYPATAGGAFPGQQFAPKVSVSVNVPPAGSTAVEAAAEEAGAPVAPPVKSALQKALPFAAVAGLFLLLRR